MLSKKMRAKPNSQVRYKPATKRFHIKRCRLSGVASREPWKCLVTLNDYWYSTAKCKVAITHGLIGRGWAARMRSLLRCGQSRTDRKIVGEWGCRKTASPFVEEEISSVHLVRIGCNHPIHEPLAIFPLWPTRQGVGILPRVGPVGGVETRTRSERLNGFIQPRDNRMKARVYQSREIRCLAHDSVDYVVVSKRNNFGRGQPLLFANHKQYRLLNKSSAYN